MVINDAHCHFFSPNLFRTLGQSLQDVAGEAADVLPDRLGWERPVSAELLADRWVAEWDRHHVDHGVLMASVPGDEESVAAAVKRHPSRVVGAFMVNPAAPDLGRRIEMAFDVHHLRMVCLFPAMHGVPMDDARVESIFAAAEARRRAVFVHCGLLSVGVREKLGLTSRFDLRLGDPLGVAAVASRYPRVPVVIPHFGAGRLQETLMAASSTTNIYLDTSSSNAWVRFHPGLTLRGVFAAALDSIGPSRILFGTDSSFFPRGWQAGVYETQLALLEDLGVESADRQRIFGGNFSQVFMS
jgi:predicted TIM-barrel fold metal-dependent hydrolase